MSTTIGRARFEGIQPSNCRTMGNIQIYYNGQFPSSNLNRGGVEYYEFEGDVWVVYGPYYNGKPKIVVISRNGTVQSGQA